MRPTADRLNAILAGGGTVQVTTYARSVLYRPRNSGMFSERDGSLYVARGKSRDRLSHGNDLLVSIRVSVPSAMHNAEMASLAARLAAQDAESAEELAFEGRS